MRGNNASWIPRLTQRESVVVWERWLSRWRPDSGVYSVWLPICKAFILFCTGGHPSLSLPHFCYLFHELSGSIFSLSSLIKAFSMPIPVSAFALNYCAVGLPSVKISFGAELLFDIAFLLRACKTSCFEILCKVWVRRKCLDRCWMMTVLGRDFLCLFAKMCWVFFVGLFNFGVWILERRALNWHLRERKLGITIVRFITLIQSLLFCSESNLG